MAMHRMGGVPAPIAIGGVVAMIVLSHLILTLHGRRARPGGYAVFDLLRIGAIDKMVKSRAFPPALQAVPILLFLLVIAAGLFGSDHVNIGPVLTWTWWWALLIFVILVSGASFCAVCPWEGLSSLITSFSFTSRIKKIGFEWKWPRRFKTIYAALALFILLTWFELGLDVTRSPVMTAVLGALFVSGAILGALLFERRAFCRYICFVGRIQGLYALFSPVELRPVSKEVCRSCEGKECYHGGDAAVGCPTSLFPGALRENTYCTLCTECISACPHDNLAINVRPFAADLHRKTPFRRDEAVLAVSLLALTSFHGLTMTPFWERLTDMLRVTTGIGPKGVFTLLMAGMLIAPALLFYVTSYAAKRLAGDRSPSTGRIFRGFAYSVIPIALFYHLAHNGMHFFMEGQNIIPLLSDPFGRGWDLFGTANRSYAPWLSLETIWWLQIGLIVTGHLAGVIAADRIARVLFKEKGDAIRGLIPLILTMILYSSFSVWLIAQPMTMRSGM